MATLDELTVEAQAEVDAAKPLYKSVNGVRTELTDDEYAEKVIDLADFKWNEQQFGYIEGRQQAYPSYGEQLDYIFHHGLDAWKADIIQPIKDQFPKP